MSINTDNTGEETLLRKALIVGVGGSGGKTLRVLRHSLMRQLRSAGWQSNELPACWQLLWIDPIFPMGTDGFDLAPQLPQDSYLGLTPPNVGWSGVLKSIEKGVADPAERKEAYSGWLPEQFNPKTSEGAGQWRAVGRGIALSRLSGVEQKIASLHAVMNGKQAEADEGVLQELLKKEFNSGTEPISMVISSLAGGSGAGMFADVADVLKTIDASFTAQKMLYILYGPDVFNSLGRSATPDVPANVLGALNEMTFGARAWSQGPGTQHIFDGQGLKPPLDKLDAAGGPGIGMRTTFLIGSGTADGMTFGGADDIYRAVGESLTPLLLDPNLYVSFANGIVNNFYPKSDQLQDKTGLKTNRKGHQPITALGFARLSLGMNRFSEYFTEVLTQESFKVLLWPGAEPQVSGDQSGATKIARRVEAVRERFIATSPITERDYGAENDKIVASLRPDSAVIIQNAIEELRAEAEQGVSPKTGSPGSTVLQKLRTAYTNRRNAIDRELSDALSVKATAWSNSIQQEIADHVSEYVAQYGLPVTVGLIRELINDQKWVAQNQMLTDSTASQSSVPTYQQSIQAALGAVANVLPGSQPIQIALNQFGSTFQARIDAEMYELIGKLMFDLADNFLAPLAEQLEIAYEDLLKEYGSLGFKSYPRFGELPRPTTLPGPTEVVLLEPDTYPMMLGEMVKTDLPEEDRPNWSELLVSRVLLGRSTDGKPLKIEGVDDLKLVNVIGDQKWIPADVRASGSGGTPRKARFLVPTTGDKLVERAQRIPMANGADTHFRKEIDQELGAYLTSAPTDQQTRARQKKFATCLKLAFAKSAPLVKYDKGFLAEVHPDPEHAEGNFMHSPKLVMSSVPSAILNIGKQEDPRGLFGKAVEEAGFSSTSGSARDVKEITFFQALGQTANPVVFDSLWNPISQRWQMVSGDAYDRETFWLNKRARPLTESLPMSVEIMESMVRGWFVSRALSLIEFSDDATRGPKVQFINSEGSGKAFPHPLLGVTERMPKEDLLPCVLLSSSLALMESNQGRSLAPLDVYKHLISLGVEGSPRVVEALQAGGEGTREELRATIQMISESHQRIFASADAAPSVFGLPQVWELRVVVNKVLNELQTLVGQG